MRNPSMTPRKEIFNFRDIPNVGPATVKYFSAIGIASPFELIGQDPYRMFADLCEMSGKKFDFEMVP
ncbi:MAG: hypothetical protein HQL32_06375 [Planctomycetes bacterium]|nr:hypothetical protein [Planctomycetota bacterium]